MRNHKQETKRTVVQPTNAPSKFDVNALSVNGAILVAGGFALGASLMALHQASKANR